MQDEQGRIWKFQEIRGFFFARYRVCSKAIIISNGSWENGEPKNVILVSVQQAHFPVRGCKLPGFMERRIGPNMEIWGNLGLPFTTVLCLHQGNNYIKRRLREWRAQNCNTCVGAKSALPSTGHQTTQFQAAPNRADNKNLRKFRASFPHGTVFAPRQQLY